MKDFFKYLAWGLLGLSLSLALPRLPLNWAALVLTPAYLSGVRRLSPWLLLLTLAFFYSAFSLQSALAFAWPWALAWLLALALRKSFQWEASEEKALVLALLCALPLLGPGLFSWMGGSAWGLDGRDLLFALFTFSLGYFGAPLFRHGIAQALRGFAALLPRRGGFDLSRADWLATRNARVSRKPFGLEKGL